MNILIPIKQEPALEQRPVIVQEHVIKQEPTITHVHVSKQEPVSSQDHVNKHEPETILDDATKQEPTIAQDQTPEQEPTIQQESINIPDPELHHDPTEAMQSNSTNQPKMSEREQDIKRSYLRSSHEKYQKRNRYIMSFHKYSNLKRTILDHKNKIDYRRKRKLLYLCVKMDHPYKLNDFWINLHEARPEELARYIPTLTKRRYDNLMKDYPALKMFKYPFKT